MRAFSLPGHVYGAGLALLLSVAAAAPAHAAAKKKPPQVSTTSITLGTDPAGATVTLVGATETKLGVTPIKSVRVPRGEVTLKITLDGYQDDTEKLTIGSSSQTFSFKLVRNIVPGELTFTADAEYAGASVTVDGTGQGIVPATFKTPPGRHQVIISKEGYQDYQRWVDVTEGMKATYDVVLTKKEAPKGTLILTSAPLGAEVKVDGQVKGKTPAVLEGMAAGDHTIEWALGDYKPAQRVVQVVPGKSVTVDVPLEALPRSLPGSLLITSNPSGGEVKVDGESKGKTPTVVEALLAGDHAVTVEVPGFKAFQKTVHVDEGKRGTLDVAMENAGKPVGDLKVVADMDGVQIYLDGELIGPAPIRKAEVEPGTHLVEGRLPNLTGIKKEIEVKAGQVTTVSLDVKVVADKVLGEVHIVSPAPGSVATIDGGEKLPLPILRSLTAGAHFIEVTSPSTAPWKMQVEITAGARQEVMAQPAPTGKVIIALPKGRSSAEVLVDGKPAGVAPITLALPEGGHIIVLRDADGSQDSRSLVVGAGQEQTIEAHLVIPEKPREIIARRSMPFSASAFRPTDGSVDFGAGWPELLQLRMGAGIIDHLDAGVTIRSQIVTLTEFELRGKYTFLDSRAFALAGEAGLGFGIGPGSRNSFGGRATGLASLFPGEVAALTLGVTLKGYTDHLKNGTGRDNGILTILSLIVEFRATEKLNLYLRLDGNPLTKARLMWHDTALKGDSQLGGAAGLSFLF